MGGVWEWTSSPLRKWDGFQPMSLYPAYTGKFSRRPPPRGPPGPPPWPPLEPWESKEHRLIPPWGNAADFFDDKHNIVLGGSWATHPRIAGRKSL